MNNNLTPTTKQIEYLQLVAKFIVYLGYHDDILGAFSGTAEMCNLHELSLAGLGHEEDYPQVPYEDIVIHVKNQMAFFENNSK